MIASDEPESSSAWTRNILPRQKIVEIVVGRVRVGHRGEREDKSESCSGSGRCVWSQVVVLPFQIPVKVWHFGACIS